MNEREKLDREIHDWLESWTAFSVPMRTIESAIHDWLDRQATITKSECEHPYCATCKDGSSKLRIELERVKTLRHAWVDKFQRRNDEYLKLKERTDILQEELNKCMAERETYRKLFGESLDHADAIIELGLNIDEGLA